MLRFMIERHYGQRQIAEGFFNEPVEDWWEPWMKKADEILDDEELIRLREETVKDLRPLRGALRASLTASSPRQKRQLWGAKNRFINNIAQQK